MEFKEELKTKLNTIIDNRIKELFETGVLQVKLVETTYDYSDSEPSRSIVVEMNGEKIYETDSEQLIC